MRAFGHVSLHWLLQGAACGLVLLLGAAPWTGTVLLVGYLLLLRRAGLLLCDELRHQSARVTVLCVLGQLPGLALSSSVALSWLVRGTDPTGTVVGLQLWTVVWTPVLALMPNTVFAARGTYLWVTLALPWLQLTWVTDPLRTGPRRLA